jgi:hypothetical protein
LVLVFLWSERDRNGNRAGFPAEERERGGVVISDPPPAAWGWPDLSPPGSWGGSRPPLVAGSPFFFFPFFLFAGNVTGGGRWVAVLAVTAASGQEVRLLDWLLYSHFKFLYFS